MTATFSDLSFVRMLSGTVFRPDLILAIVESEVNPVLLRACREQQRTPGEG